MIECIHLYERTWCEEEMGGLGAQLLENFLKPHHLLWLGMHLPSLSLLLVTRNIESLWQLFARHGAWKKVWG